MSLPPLIPAPADISATGAEGFGFGADTRIVVGERSSDQTLFAARQAQAAVRDATGLVPSLGVASSGSRIELRLVGQDGSEAYELSVGPDRITISASGEAGLFYGVQTFKQLLKTCGGRIPALEIRDRPALAHRGLMLDVSRGKVPTLETLLDLVDKLAAYKYNQLQLYIEHTFDFPSHADIGAGTDPLTADDILALDAACRARHVELIPNLQSFGHQRHLLSQPRYNHLDEVGWRWSLTPAREETYQLLDELYAEFLPAFSSGWLNVDCDETYDLGAGQSAELAAELGKGRLYLRHILRLRELSARYGRRIMLWADILHKYPDLIGELPDDVLLLDWQYQARDHYPTTDALAGSGRAFWVCPGTSSWNTLFPRLDNAIGNIRGFVRDGIAGGAGGMLLTDWGDYGHYQPLSLSWYAYLFGAATAWTGARTTPEEFDAAFAPLFLDRPVGDVALGALRSLGTLTSTLTVRSYDRSASALALFDEPLTGSLIELVAPQALDDLESAALEAIAAFASLPDAGLRHDYGFMARLIAFAADKVRASQEVRQALRALAASSDGVSLEPLGAGLAGVRARLPALRSEFEAVWLRHARRSEIQFVLDHFDALDARYAAAIAWLESQRDGVAAGQRVDAELGSYTAEPYLPLWLQGDAGHRRLNALVSA